MDIPVNRQLYFSDPAQKDNLPPALSKKLQEAAQRPGADIVLENEEHIAHRISLQDYLAMPADKSFDTEKARLVIDTAQGAVVLDLKRLSKYHLLSAMENLCEKPIVPISEELLGNLNDLRQQIIGQLPPSDKNWNLRQAFPTAGLEDLKKYEGQWQAGSLTENLPMEAFTDLLSTVPAGEGTTYAVPPSQCEQVYQRLGTEIRNWQQLKTALQEIGVPDRNLHRLYHKQVEPFIEHLWNTLPLAPVSSYRDLSLDRSELFQSLWQAGGMSEATFADLIASTPQSNGDKTVDLPPQTCQRLYQALGKSILCWEDLEAALKDVGVGPDRIRAVYSHQVTQFVQKQQIPENSVLFLANADPNDLHMDEEAAKVKQQFGDKNVVVMKRPTLEEMEALVQSGRFSRVWVAGHGLPAMTVFTDSMGQRRDIKNQDLVKALSSHPAVRMVMGSICWGAFGGAHSLVNGLSAKGIHAIGYESVVGDGYAIAMSEKVAKGLHGKQTLSKAVTWAFQQTEAKRYPTGETRLSYVPRDVHSRQTYTSSLLAERFAAAVRHPEEAEPQQVLQQTLSSYPALQPLQELIQAIQGKDFARLSQLAAQNPLLKTVLENKQVQSGISALKAESTGTAPNTGAKRPQTLMTVPKDPEERAQFMVRLVKDVASSAIWQLLQQGRLQAFAQGLIIPRLGEKGQHVAEILSKLDQHFGQAIKQLDSQAGAEPVKILLGEYPGLQQVFGLIEALRQGDHKAFGQILARQPQLAEIGRGLRAEWQARGNLTIAEQKSFVQSLRLEGMHFYVAQQFLEEKKSFVQVDGDQALPLK